MKNVSYILFLISFNLFAAGISVSERILMDSVNGTKLLYINGQENEEIDALKSRNRISSLIKVNEGLDGLIDINSKVELDHVYNRTFGLNDGAGALPDFMESLVLLILDSNEDASLNEVWQAVYQTIYNLITPENSTFISQAGVIDILKDQDAFQRLYNSTGQIGVELQNRIIETLAEDKNLILISHSQGNLFANVSYQDLVNEDIFVLNGESIRDYEHRIGNLQIATPANAIEINKAEYITNNKDAILRVPFSLPGNFNLITPQLPDPRGGADAEENHGFNTTYLSGLNEGNLIQLRDELFQKLIDVSSELGEELVLCEHGIINSFGDFLSDNSNSCLVFDSAEFGTAGVLRASANNCPFRPIDGFSTTLEMFNISGNGSSVSSSGSDFESNISVQVNNSVPNDGRFVFFNYTFDIFRENIDFSIINLYQEEGALRCIAQQE